MATPPVKPTAPTTPPRSTTQGSVDPREHPHTSHSEAVTISHAPPLPVRQPIVSDAQKPVMETGDAEQEAGKTAMDTWKKRQAAEEEAGKAAVQRYASLRPPVE